MSAEGPLLSTEVAEKLKSWRGGQRYWVGVDVGATNTRISICTEHEHFLLYRFVSNSTRHQLQVFEQLVQEFSPLVGGQGASGAAIAGAGRILKHGETMDITNFKGGVEHQLLHKAELPSLLFPGSATAFLNDLQAASYGVLSLAESGQLGRYFTPLWGSPSDLNRDRGHYLIVAPGTGLGASTLLWFDEVQKYIAMPLEAGHTLVPLVGPDHPDFAQEQDLLQFISKRCWSGQCAAEWEDLVCGQGVVNIYLWLCQRHQQTPPPQLSAQVVVDLAVGTPANPLAVEALYLHYRYMARFSANLAICTQVTGVFWAGSNQVLNDPFIRARVGALQQDWQQHTKAAWLDDVPVLGQVEDVNVNLLGTFLIAKRLPPASASPSPLAANL
jgi:glucokinase